MQRNPLEEMENVASGIAQTDQHLKDSLTSISRRLEVICRTANTSYPGENFTLETYGDDEAVYGYLFCDVDGLQVAYRSTEEDFMDAAEQRCYEPSYSIKPVDELNVTWMRSIFEQRQLEKFCQQFALHLQDLQQALHDQTAMAQRNQLPPQQELGQAVVDVASRVGFASVRRDWEKAQGRIFSDPDEAMTASSSLIESTCKHILAEMGRPLPKDQSISPLYEAVADAFNFPRQPAGGEELHGLARALGSAVRNIGALRTKYGSAHGRGPGHPFIAQRDSRLAVNAAGVVATFLMETFEEQRARAGH